MNLSFLLLTWLSVAFQATAADTVTNPESRKLLQHRIDPGLLDEVASDFSKTELPTLESFLRRKGEKASPPSPPSPARSEMCMGIPFKRYRFVKSMGEIRNALSQAKPGDLIEVKSGVYYQGRGPGSSSLIPPLLDVEGHGPASARAPKIKDPRNKKKPPVKSLLGAQYVDPAAPGGGGGSDSEEVEDMSFADLYELYSEWLEEHIDGIAGLDEPPAPAPGLGPAVGANKPSKKPGKPDKPKRPIFSGIDGLGASPEAPEGPPGKPGKPGKGSDEPEFDIIEIDEDRFESYYSEDEADNLPGDVNTPKPIDPSKPSGPTQGWVTPTGTIDNVHGTIEEPITLCGPKTAVFDGSNGNGGLAAAALRVVKSSNVRVVGFTLQNALKGLDVQMTNASTFANVSTRYTLQEGIRLRYNSTHNNVFGCNITFTGRLWAGIGEGVYVGTSTRNSIAAGRPEDRSDFNTISHNTFGEGIPAENIDLKEYTYGGTVANNTFNGTGIEGLNGAIAWVAIKGRGYTIANNTGAGTLRGGQGYRVLQVLIADNEDNTLTGNSCADFENGSFCVFVDSRAKNTTVDCQNRRYVSVNATSRSTKRVCNCNIDDRCSDASGYVTIKRAGSDDGSTSGFKASSFDLLPRSRVEDQWEFRRDWD